MQKIYIKKFIILKNIAQNIHCEIDRIDRNLNQKLISNYP